MKYCVVKNKTSKMTSGVISGPSKNIEVLIQDAQSAGFTENEVEILTEEEYEARKDLEPKPITEPTEIEILKQEKEILAQGVYDLTTIVELILTGGIAE